MTRNILLLFSLLLWIAGRAGAQALQPGFDRDEYAELLKINARHGDSTFVKKIPPPQHSAMVYRSPVVGIDNQWDLWMRDDKVAILSIRGTTAKQISWAANFYAAMTAAVGEIKINNTDTFRYHLADNPKAAVHIGWLLCTAYLSKDMLPRIDSCYRAGIREMIIMGHSQGGAIAYLVTAHFHNLQQQGRLPADIRFKTYCSAAPKPGNLFFAYDYENATRGGWAYNVVNAADWVPETPFSVQTLDDFNTTNPFVGARKMIRKQKFPMNWVAGYAYRRMSKPSFRAQRRYQRYLGGFVSKAIKKHLPGYVPPAYFPSNDYVRVGPTIVLPNDEAYYKQFPDGTPNVFMHHLFEAYLYLTAKLPARL
ncbi:lipase family protein [Taibaiella chishuiensis]|uniref:Lipase (Class 3) n=1 Tax=Taibaiella chishuiensis TaxID=1434707 RepID=A0A2P8D5Z0_9BACT|nr:lipase [Taibaiella chishuiensis]PSK92633.1 lipase (class 3) [Taibaiella chishuiensis]